ncbi:GspE/PulE family protein [Elusimicrobiota bacterium]
MASQRLTLAKKKIGELLIEAKLLNDNQLGEALGIQKEKGGKIGKILVDRGYITEQVLLTYLGKQCGIGYVSLSSLGEIPKSILEIIPFSTTRRQLLIPIKKEGRKLTVAMADPLNVFVLDDLKLTTGLDIIPVIASTDEISGAIDKFYEKEKSVEEMAESTEKEYEEALEKIEDSGEFEEVGDQAQSGLSLDEKVIGAPVVKLVNAILSKAITAKASDIHFEPYEKSFRVRYRIDGVLQEQPYPPKRLQNSVIARIKVLAKADISEKRVPQDGRIKLKMAGKDIDLRVSFVPSVFGEKVVLRLLDSSGLKLSLNQLGLEPDNLAVYAKVIRCPYGMILITGPTGSGKSTTLYSSIFVLNSPANNIMTIEDPVEYIIAGINQVNIKPDIGFNFAAGLRAFLRQDPDIIMVGEIRDKETAEIAANAALTGHMVFATLHTNDASSVPARLAYLGVEPFLIASSLLAVVAQRLIRVCCNYCKKPYEIDSAELVKLGIPDIYLPAMSEKLTIYKTDGCDKCSFTGYKGRMGIHEIMEINDELREAIVRRAPTLEIKDMATKNGMAGLRISALRKVLNGSTTIEELLRITAET